MTSHVLHVCQQDISAGPLEYLSRISALTNNAKVQSQGHCALLTPFFIKTEGFMKVLNMTKCQTEVKPNDKVMMLYN